AITIPVAPLRRLLTIIVVLVVLGGLAIFALAQRDSIRAAFGGAEASYIDNTTYQSVVLTTNQVYFGKLRIDGDVYVLTEVYSLATSGDPNSGNVQVITPPLRHAKYQAVFLTNGQTYFGSYLDRLGPYAKVENAFYISQQPTADENQTPESRLIRRGSELHAPVPSVLIPKSAILFVEDLRADSQVAQFMERELAK